MERKDTPGARSNLSLCWGWWSRLTRGAASAAYARVEWMTRGGSTASPVAIPRSFGVHVVGPVAEKGSEVLFPAPCVHILSHEPHSKFNDKIYIRK